MSSSPIIRTRDRAGAIKFLEYLLDGVRAGEISGWNSVFEPSGTGRHCITPDQESSIPFDLSDMGDERLTPTPAEGPRAKARSEQEK